MLLPRVQSANGTEMRSTSGSWRGPGDLARRTLAQISQALRSLWCWWLFACCCLGCFGYFCCGSSNKVAVVVGSSVAA